MEIYFANFEVSSKNFLRFRLKIFKKQYNQKRFLKQLNHLRGLMNVFRQLADVLLPVWPNSQ